ncbi:MAG: hypothetical protein AAGC47_12880, partial [Bacteroidota bacterium]
MNRFLKLFVILFLIVSRLSAQVNEQDSLALAALYESTDGDNWDYNDNWLEGPVESWYGIEIEEGRVEKIYLWQNNLSGTLPDELGQLTALERLELPRNRLVGQVPSSLTNLSLLHSLDLQGNELTILPNLTSLEDLYGISISDNYFTVQMILDNAQLFDWRNQYFPQRKFGESQAFNIDIDESRVLDFDVPEEGVNAYQWYFNFEELAGADQVQLDISQFDESQKGTYFLRISNSSFPDFYLESEKIYLNELPNSCDHPFTATGGLNIVPDKESWFRYQATETGPVLIYSENDSYSFGRNVQAFEECGEGSLDQVWFSWYDPRQEYLQLNLVAGQEILLLWNEYDGHAKFEWHVEKPESTPSEQKQALINIYQATNGDGWHNNSNWLSDLPVSNWHGVDIDLEGNVVGLDLRNNNLVGDLPLSIGNLPELRSLDLAANELTGAIHDQLGDLEHLLDLNLSDNGLTSTIPATIGNLDNLYWIDLSSNELVGGVPQTITEMDNLEEFYAAENYLDELPDLSSLRWRTGVIVPNNKLDFGDLEINVDFFDFEWNYSPQRQIGEEQHLTPSAGDQIQLGFSEGTDGTNNSYQWYKDYAIIEGANDPDYSIDTYATSDAGIYLLKINNSLLPHLELVSEKIYVNADENSCENTILISQGTQVSPTLPLWYKYIASEDETILIYPESPSFNTTVETFEDCNDFGSRTRFNSWDRSYYQRSLAAGEEILIRWSSSYSSGDLEWHLVSADPTPSDQRNALVSLYQNTEGRFWNNNHNWLADYPVSSWSGVFVDPSGNIIELSLAGNNLEGPLTVDIAGLPYLERLDISRNSLEGSIPEEITQLSNLALLEIDRNYFDGLPDLTAISSLENLSLTHNMFDFEDLLPNRSLLQYGYQYAPQRLKLGNEEVIELTEGQYHVFDQGTVNAPGTEYQWFKDFEVVPNENESIYEIPSYTSQDDGVYMVHAFHSELPELIILSEKIHLNRVPNTCESPEVVIAGTHTSPEPERWYSYTSNYNQTILIELETNDQSYNRVDADFFSDCFEEATLRSSISNYDQLEISLEAGEEILIKFFHDRSVEGFTWTIKESGSTTAAQRQALVDFYNALNGDDWRKNDNWLSNREPAAWYGVVVDDDGNVIELDLWNNRLSGSLPETINLPYLRSLQLSLNDIEGTVPNGLEELESIRTIDLRENKLSGLEYMDANRDDLYIGVSRNAIPFDQLEQNEHLLTDDYQYEDQLIAFGTETELSPNIGETLTLDPGFISGQSNHYQWYKNYEPIEGATERALTIEDYSDSDDGIFYLEVESGILEDLVVESERFFLNITPNSCSNPHEVSVGEWI